jgi:hypothetical protein
MAPWSILACHVIDNCACEGLKTAMVLYLFMFYLFEKAMQLDNDVSVYQMLKIF